MSRGQGQVVPSQEIQVVQSLEGGILQELLVAEGDMVKKDQPLLRISDVMFASEERGTEQSQPARQEGAAGGRGQRDRIHYPRDVSEGQSSHRRQRNGSL